MRWHESIKEATGLRLEEYCRIEKKWRMVVEEVSE